MQHLLYYLMSASAYVIRSLPLTQCTDDETEAQGGGITSLAPSADAHIVASQFL